MPEENYDFKKEWEKTKKQLLKFSQDASNLAKKGEKELLRFSHTGKLHIDSKSLLLKKEKLYYLIGKEYAQLKTKSKGSKALSSHLEELKKINKELGSLKRKLATKKKTTRAIKK